MEHLAQHGYEAMPVIARELRGVLTADPDVVADIYEAVFAYEEPSDDATDMSGSQILALTSNKRQDYDQSKWQLAEYYPSFVQEYPVLATKAMLKVIDVYRMREHKCEMPPEA